LAFGDYPRAGWPVTLVGMDSFALVGVVLALWIVIGLVTGVWMIRRGYNAMWVLIAVTFGPLFVPIALKPAERGSRLARSGPGGPPVPLAQPPAGPRNLDR